MDNLNEGKILADLGKKLQKLRISSKLSIREFAYASELSVSYIQKLEAGKSNPSYTTLLKLAAALEVDLNDLKVNW